MPNKAKVVAAYLDGRRLKGYTNDFSPARDHFYLFPETTESAATGARGTAVRLAELKALFFVKDFTGDPAHVPTNNAIVQSGKKIEMFEVEGKSGRSAYGGTTDEAVQRAAKQVAGEIQRINAQTAQ